MRSHLLAFSLTAALSFGSTGCIKKTLTDGQIEGTRQGAGGVDSIADYDLGRTAAAAGIAQFEGMHVLSPDNANALYLLMKTWAGYGFGFAEDDLQAAQDSGDDDLIEYQKRRTRSAYDRSIFCGLQLMGQKAQGFEQARKNEATLTKWLNENFKDKEDAPTLLWTGQAWLLRVNVMKGDDAEGPQFIAELWVGVAMLNRAVQLDASAEHYGGLVALAAYHARNAMAELPEAKKGFDEALAKTENKTLLVQFTYATTYACVKGDIAAYQDQLNKVLQATDPDPGQRLTNTIAKRRAKRWINKRRAKDQCGFDLPGK